MLKENQFMSTKSWPPSSLCVIIYNLSNTIMTNSFQVKLTLVWSEGSTTTSEMSAKQLNSWDGIPIEILITFSPTGRWEMLIITNTGKGVAIHTRPEVTRNQRWLELVAATTKNYLICSLDLWANICRKQKFGKKICSPQTISWTCSHLLVRFTGKYCSNLQQLYSWEGCYHSNWL